MLCIAEWHCCCAVCSTFEWTSSHSSPWWAAYSPLFSTWMSTAENHWALKNKSSSVWGSWRLATVIAHWRSVSGLAWQLYTTRLCGSEAIWSELRNTYLPTPTLATWINSATRFETLCHFPHSVGAIDGKHIVIQAPPNSGSLYYNYKGTFSIVLLAVVNAEYRFIAADIGAYGSSSDGGVLHRSALGHALQRQQLNMSQESVLSNFSQAGKQPYFLVGDEAFPMETYLLRPYPGRRLPTDKKIFNYRLSRARRVVEQAFGLPAARWRIFQRRITLSPDNAQKVVQAAIILHSVVQHSTPTGSPSELPNPTDDGPSTSSLQPMNMTHTGRGNNRPCNSALAVRETFKGYFNSAEGSVDWQLRAVASG